MVLAHIGKMFRIENFNVKGKISMFLCHAKVVVRTILPGCTIALLANKIHRITMYYSLFANKKWNKINKKSYELYVGELSSQYHHLFMKSLIYKWWNWIQSNFLINF